MERSRPGSKHQGSTSASSTRLPKGSQKNASLRLMAGRTNGSLTILTPRPKLGQRVVHAGDLQAEMMVAAVIQAIAEFCVRAHFRGQRVSAAEHLM